MAGPQTVQLLGDLGGWAGQGTAGPHDHDLVAVGVQRPAAWRLRAEQVGVPSGRSPVREDDPDPVIRTSVIAVGWSLFWQSRAGGWWITVARPLRKQGPVSRCERA